MVDRKIYLKNKVRVNEGDVSRIEVFFSFATVFSFCLKLKILEYLTKIFEDCSG